MNASSVVLMGILSHQLRAEAVLAAGIPAAACCQELGRAVHFGGAVLCAISRPYWPPPGWAIALPGDQLMRASGACRPCQVRTAPPPTPFQRVQVAAVLVLEHHRARSGSSAIANQFLVTGSCFRPSLRRPGRSPVSLVLSTRNRIWAPPRPGTATVRRLGARSPLIRQGTAPGTIPR